MNAPRSTDRRSHDPEDRPQRQGPQRRSELPASAPSSGTPPALAAGQGRRPVPSTPGELVAMQRPAHDILTPPPLDDETRLALVLELLRAQNLNPWECQQIALALLQQLEAYHQAVVAEMHDTPQSTPAQVACWAIDGDRLMHCRRLLESITLI